MGGKIGSVVAALVLFVVTSLVIGPGNVAAGADGGLPEDAVSTKYGEAFARLYALELFTGTDKGKFEPYGPFTRAQCAKIAVALSGKLGESEALRHSASPFADVRAGAWYTGYVNMAYNLGIVGGDPPRADGSRLFRPDDPVKYAEVAKILVRALGYRPANQTWPEGYVITATEKGLLVAVQFDAGKPAVRGEVALMTEAAVFHVEAASGGTIAKNVFAWSPPTDDAIPQGAVDILARRGGHVTDVKMSPDGATVYAVAHGTDSVYAIDTASGLLKNVVYLASASPFGAMPYRAAVSPDGETLYTANRGDSTVSVIDIERQQVVGTVQLRDVPWDVHASADGKSVYVPMANWELPGAANPGLAVIDTATGTLETTVELPDGLPFTVTSTHDGTRILVATIVSSSCPEGCAARLYTLDSTTLRVLRHVDLEGVGENWGELVVTADDRTLYFSGGQKINKVFKVDLASNQLQAVFEVPVEATDLQLSADETKLWALSPGSHMLYCISLESGACSSVLDVNTAFLGQAGWASGDMRGMAVSADCLRAYIGAFEAEAVLAADLSTRTWSDLVRLNDYRTEIWDIAISPEGSRVYVGENSRTPGIPHSIIVIDTVLNRVLYRIPLETNTDGTEVYGGTIGMNIAADGRTLYACTMDGEVVEIDLDAGSVVREFRAVPPGGEREWSPLLSDVLPVPEIGRLFFTVQWDRDLAGAVGVVDLESGETTGYISLEWLPQRLALSPDGDKLFVSRHGSQSSLGERFNPAEIEWFTRAAYCALDPTTGGITAANRPENSYAPTGRIDLFQLDPSGARLYYYAGRDQVGVVDVGRDSPVGTIDLRTGRHGPVGVHPGDAAFSPDGSRIYVPCGDSYMLATVDTSTLLPVGWVKLGLEPTAIAIAPDGRYAYVTNRRSEEVSVVDLVSGKVVRTVSLRRTAYR